MVTIIFIKLKVKCLTHIHGAGKVCNNRMSSLNYRFNNNQIL